MATCKHPDRDEPRLVCGYPMPCPHHTVVIDVPTVDEVIDRAQLLVWLKRSPATLVTMRITDGQNGPQISIAVTYGFAEGEKHHLGECLIRHLPTTASIVEIRNAHEELTIEARAALEAKIKP